MPLHPLTYTCGAAPCPTLGGRTGEALGGAADGFGGRDEALAAGDITDSKSAKFTVTLIDPKASGTLRYIYPSAMAGATGVDYNKLATQDGTLATLASNFDLAVYEGSLTAEKTSIVMGTVA